METTQSGTLVMIQPVIAANENTTMLGADGSALELLPGLAKRHQPEQSTMQDVKYLKHCTTHVGASDPSCRAAPYGLGGTMFSNRREAVSVVPMRVTEFFPHLVASSDSSDHLVTVRVTTGCL